MNPLTMIRVFYEANFKPVMQSLSDAEWIDVRDAVVHELADEDRRRALDPTKGTEQLNA